MGKHNRNPVLPVPREQGGPGRALGGPSAHARVHCLGRRSAHGDAVVIADGRGAFGALRHGIQRRVAQHPDLGRADPRSLLVLDGARGTGGVRTLGDELGGRLVVAGESGVTGDDEESSTSPRIHRPMEASTPRRTIPQPLPTQPRAASERLRTERVTNTSGADMRREGKGASESCARAGRR